MKSPWPHPHPGNAVREEAGTVEVLRHASENLAAPLVEPVKTTWHGESACVLTRTNDEAAQMVRALARVGIPARLVQSVDGFRFSNLAEVRFFLRRIDRETTTPVIGAAQAEIKKHESWGFLSARQKSASSWIGKARTQPKKRSSCSRCSHCAGADLPAPSPPHGKMFSPSSLRGLPIDDRRFWM